MKRLSLFVVLCATSTAFAQSGGDVEIICKGFVFRETAGIMSVSGEVKNNTPYALEDLKVKIEFLSVTWGTVASHTETVGSISIRTDGLAPGEQRKIIARTESMDKTWNDYRMSFYDGTTPLLWRLPRKKR